MLLLAVYGGGLNVALMCALELSPLLRNVAFPFRVKRARRGQRSKAFNDNRTLGLIHESVKATFPSWKTGASADGINQ